VKKLGSKLNFVKKKMTNPLVLFLPDSLLNHFDLLAITELGEVSSKKMIYHIELAENNDLPKDYNRLNYESKGFYPEKTIQDFPRRGKAVYLMIKRRRRREKQSRIEIKSDYLFMAEGSK
jgi:hypothetical protein